MSVPLLQTSVGSLPIGSTMSMFGFLPNVRLVPTYADFAPSDGPNYDLYTVPSGKRALLTAYTIMPGGINGPTTSGIFAVKPQVKISGTYYKVAQASAGTNNPQTSTISSGIYIAEAGEVISLARATTYVISAAAAHTNTALALSAVVAPVDGVAVYAGTITNGATSAFAGYTFVVTGFATAANNGTFLCVSSSTTTLSLVNLAAANETHAGTATTQEFTTYTGVSISTTERGNYVTFAGFANSANNGRFLVLTSTATTLVVANANGISESIAATGQMSAYFSAYANIIEFDDTAPLKSIKILSAVQGPNLLYSPSGSKNGYISSSMFAGPTVSNPAGVLAYNDSASIAQWWAQLLKGNTETAVLSAASLAVGGFTAYTGNFQEAASAAFAITASANAAGGTTDYTGTFTGGGTNGYAGQMFLVTGMANAANNGLFRCTASSATVLTLNNASGVSSTVQVSTAVLSPLSNRSVTISGFVNAGNNGTFNCVFATSTVIVVSNAGGVAETHAGTMTVAKAATFSNRATTNQNISANAAAVLFNAAPFTFVVANGDTLQVWVTSALPSGFIAWVNVLEF